MIVTEQDILKCLSIAQKTRPEKLFLNESDLVVNFVISLTSYFKQRKIKILVNTEVYTDHSPLIKNNMKSRFDLFIVATQNKVVENYIFEFKYIISHNKCILGLNFPTLNKFIPVGSLFLNFKNQRDSIEKDLVKVSKYRSMANKLPIKLYGYHITIYNENCTDQIFNDENILKYKPSIKKLMNVKIDISKKHPKKKYEQILHTIVRSHIPKKKRDKFDLYHLSLILSESKYSNYDEYWHSNSNDAVSAKIFNSIRDLYETALDKNAYPVYIENLNCAIIKC